MVITKSHISSAGTVARLLLFDQVPSSRSPYGKFLPFFKEPILVIRPSHRPIQWAPEEYVQLPGREVDR
jgi:hypothetical protein